MSFSLKGKVVLITGASSGIGEACAYRFAKAGCDLIIVARRKERLTDLKKTLVSRYKISVLDITLDVRKRNDVKKKLGSLQGKWKNVNVLINNAGLSRGLNKIQDGRFQDWEEMIDTNMKGVLYVTKYVLPFLMNQPNAHIINIGSIAGKEVYPAGNVYCATKHALDAITKGMRMDLLDTNVRVSTVDPGLAETEFSEVRFHGDKHRAKKVYTGIKPLKGDDVADAVYFVASRDPNVVIAEMTLFPKAQASSIHINRK